MRYLVFEKPPKDFAPTVEAAGCYCEFEDKLLFMKRHRLKPQGLTWGIPGGKLERGEDRKTAVIRETLEEAGLRINDADLEEIASLYVRLPHVDYVFHLFRKRFCILPSIQLSLDEMEEARWVTPHDAYKLPLIAGGMEALQCYEKFVIGRN